MGIQDDDYSPSGLYDLILIGAGPYPDAVVEATAKKLSVAEENLRVLLKDGDAVIERGVTADRANEYFDLLGPMRGRLEMRPVVRR